MNSTPKLNTVFFMHHVSEFRIPIPCCKKWTDGSLGTISSPVSGTHFVFCFVYWTDLHEGTLFPHHPVLPSLTLNLFLSCPPSPAAFAPPLSLCLWFLKVHSSCNFGHLAVPKENIFKKGLESKWLISQKQSPEWCCFIKNWKESQSKSFFNYQLKYHETSV